MPHPFVFPGLLSLLAGLCTGLGGLVVYASFRDKRAVLSLGLGFSAGVMLYVSFVELLASAQATLVSHYASAGKWMTLAGFFGGMAAIGVIDRVVPDAENPHEAIVLREDGTPETANDLGEHRLMRMGLLTALAITIHNFPEGMATFVSAMEDRARGVSVAIAVAIHNIPEGIAVALPIFYATKNRKKAAGFAFLSGATEPIGAVIGYALMSAVLPDHARGVIEAAVAGIMVFISLDQLIPNAHAYSKGHLPMYGLVGGMAVMALTLTVL